jgi:hypothetical protein
VDAEQAQALGIEPGEYLALLSEVLQVWRFD